MKYQRLQRIKSSGIVRRHLVPASTLVVAMVMALVISLGPTANANHAWGGYHWARTSNPFTLKLSNNLSAAWQPYLQTTSTDWSASSVLDTIIVRGSKSPRTCQPTLGQVEVCNAKYGRNGWLGLATIWINGSHITQGTTKVNDTYFAMAAYNSPAEKNHVMCQEVGHAFGLAHQDESGATLHTCMDYSMDATSQHPNAHDYEQLEQIYSHLDTTSTVAAVTSGASARNNLGDNAQNWGRRVFRSQNGYYEVYEKQFQDGTKAVSLVILAEHNN